MSSCSGATDAPCDASVVSGPPPATPTANMSAGVEGNGLMGLGAEQGEIHSNDVAPTNPEPPAQIEPGTDNGGVCHHTGVGAGPATATNDADAANQQKMKRKDRTQKKKKQHKNKAGEGGKSTAAKNAKVPATKKIDCSFWLEGHCTKGDECPFSHSATPQKKEDVCQFFKSGYCVKGDQCLYSHDLKTVPCIHYNAGHCNKGDLCPYGHFLSPINDLHIQQQSTSPIVQDKERPEQTAETGEPASRKRPPQSTVLPIPSQPRPLLESSQTPLQARNIIPYTAIQTTAHFKRKKVQLDSSHLSDTPTIAPPSQSASKAPGIALAAPATTTPRTTPITIQSACATPSTAASTTTIQNSNSTAPTAAAAATETKTTATA
ncbi:hypothetical protein Pelo_12903 [Pelomyxa schiedti]|nr:hypothetical protein Pelo_12903 [Pelomyxa schiedti]